MWIRNSPTCSCLLNILQATVVKISQQVWEGPFPNEDVTHHPSNRLEIKSSELESPLPVYLSFCSTVDYH